MSFKLPHVAIGVFTLIVFILTGLYLSVRFPEAYAHNLAVRYQFRANHVYLLMSGLLNLLAGLLRSPTQARTQHAADVSGSIALLVAPAIFVVAFFEEPPLGASARPLTWAGVVLTLVAVLLLWFARLEVRSRAE